MKIYHEAPLSIFDKVQDVTDGDYCLVHLCEENVEYLYAFVKAVEKGREVILDNSIFELEEAFESSKYAKWVEIIKPTWYIIPDVLNQCQATIDSFDKFIAEYPNLPGKTIAVAQGETYEDFIRCYKYLANHEKVDKVALSFDYPWLQDYPGENKYYRMMNGRRAVLKRMVDEGIINTNKPHHLLGCSLPQEYIPYQGYEWIDSVDTSNPVVAGIYEIKYLPTGLESKVTQKLFTLINDDVVDKWDNVLYNIRKFRQFCNGV